MERLEQDVRHGVTLLWRFPAVTIRALLALAPGTGVNTALFQHRQCGPALRAE